MAKSPSSTLHDELHGYYLDELSPGMSAAYAKTVTDADIVLYAGISGDTNPIHLNEEFSAGTVFESRIAHGMLTASFISTVIGTKLPGPGCIYLSQTMKFKAPVRSGETVVARATVKDVNVAKKRVVLETTCMVGGEIVLEGEAIIMVPERQKS